MSKQNHLFVTYISILCACDCFLCLTDDKSEKAKKKKVDGDDADASSDSIDDEQVALLRESLKWQAEALPSKGVNVPMIASQAPSKKKQKSGEIDRKGVSTALLIQGEESSKLSSLLCLYYYYFAFFFCSFLFMKTYFLASVISIR